MAGGRAGQQDSEPAGGAAAGAAHRAGQTEPDKDSGAAGSKQLPQDRESLYYFNLREIPPKSDKPNTLQIALQTRIKLFYRPTAIVPSRADMATPWQEQLTLTRQGDGYQVNNPTPYYITIVDAGSKSTAKARRVSSPS